MSFQQLDTTKINSDNTLSYITNGKGGPCGPPFFVRVFNGNALLRCQREGVTRLLGNARTAQVYATLTSAEVPYILMVGIPNTSCGQPPCRCIPSASSSAPPVSWPPVDEPGRTPRSPLTRRASRSADASTPSDLLCAVTGMDS